MKLYAQSESPEETFQLGSRLGLLLEPGLLILLEADVGGGKTTFVKGVMNDIDGQIVSSPSFTLINQYQKDDLTVRHIDLYRLEDLDIIVRTIGEYHQENDGVSFVEWASIAGELPGWDVMIRMKPLKDEESRSIEFISGSERGVKLLNEMKI